MKKLISTIVLCIAATTAHASNDNKPDCRHQIVDKNILSMCLHKGGPFQHDHYSLSLNYQLILHLVDDYVEKIDLEHTIPSGPSIEFPLSRQAGLSRVRISGGCVPVSKDEAEVARKCDFSWGNQQVIRNVWFDFSDKNDPTNKLCQIGQMLVAIGKHADGIPPLDTCIKDIIQNDQLRRQALIQRAWANYSLEKLQEARKDQEAAFAISPAQSYNELINAATYLKDLKLHREALSFLYQAELFDKLNKQVSMMTQYHIGWNLHLLGRNDEAVKVLTDAIPAQPEYAFVYYQRGLAYEGLANRTAAKADFEKVNELFNKSPGTDMKSPLMQAVIRKLAEYDVKIDSPQN